MLEVLTSIIISRRKEKKLTQAQMAKYLGVCRQTYVNIEKGKMSLSQFVELCSKTNLEIQLIKREHILLGPSITKGEEKKAEEKPQLGWREKLAAKSK